MRKFGMLALTVLMIILPCGCGKLNEMLEEKPWEPGETALYMKKDGSLTETILDRLDEGYYNRSELENMISSSVSNFNRDYGSDSVTVDELTFENNQVKLTMTYRSAEDYSLYNNVTFFNGSMLEAEMEGFRLEGSFRKIADGEVAQDHVPYEEALKHKEYQVMVTDLSHVVQVPGEVRYLSENAKPMGEREAGPAGPADEEAPGKAYMYIIYDF